MFLKVEEWYLDVVGSVGTQVGRFALRDKIRARAILQVYIQRLK